MNINGNTAIYGIIGNPLSHSFSPAMHNAAFEACSVNAVYVPFEVKSLLQLKHSIKQLNIRGLSVTIPYKEKIARFLDIIDPMALQIGSVNTIARDANNLLIGYNTDGLGAVAAIDEFGFDLRQKKVLIIGSGGSARAIGFALLKKEIAQLTIMARNHRAGRHLVRNLALLKNGPQLSFLRMPQMVEQSNSKRRFTTKIKLPGLIKKPVLNKRKIIGHFFESDLLTPEQIHEFDLIIQTTPLGMSSYQNPLGVNNLPLSPENLRARQVVFDIVYNPHMTPFLQAAKQKKCGLIYGYKMLLYQGCKQFELFTSMTAPVQIMEKALLEQIKKINANTKPV